MNRNYSPRREHNIAQMLNHLILCLLMMLLLYPLGLTMWGSLKGTLEFQNTQWYPTLPLWIENYKEAYRAIWRYLLNTIIVGAVGTAGLLLQASVAAFVFARMKFLGKEVLYTLVISLMMVPSILSLVPLYMIYKSLNLLNSYWALIVPMWTTGPIFGIFLLRVFFAAIPEEIFEAARIDGCGPAGLYARICVPLSLSILGALSVMSVIGAWNDLLWPVIAISDNKYMTISAGLVNRFVGSSAMGGSSTNYPILFSGYSLASLPLIILFLFTSRTYVQGLTSSAVKM
ncbi:carbohydrate ABC transporter permease [Paenibacillus psychroresistens]|uniref:Carbohydrate ABC transporter permease n=1 Tax=Paenibacillus psychroresistens TaxID=1778678 RepID=A0A6B8RD68_9BACL|nr:carbohydrate ABC transporter permease [Paenibacillus psychroresistens]QGQ94100.1 carbohydrate ABC transporter permease [Paenibacillus psychroresistens]